MSQDGYNILNLFHDIGLFMLGWLVFTIRHHWNDPEAWGSRRS